MLRIRFAPFAVLAALLAQGCATATRRQAVPLHLETQAVVSGFPDGIRYFPRDAAQLQQFEEDMVESWKREQATRRAQGYTGPLPPAAYLAISGGGTTAPSERGCSPAGRRPARARSSSSSRA